MGVNWMCWLNPEQCRARYFTIQDAEIVRGRHVLKSQRKPSSLKTEQQYLHGCVCLQSFFLCLFVFLFFKKKNRKNKVVAIKLCDP